MYAEGDTLTKQYKLVSLYAYYATSQLCSEKGFHVVETSLYSQRSENISLKFNGKSYIAKGNTATLTKLNMEKFLRAVGNVIERFGLEKFYMKDTDGKMKYLPEKLTA